MPTLYDFTTLAQAAARLGISTSDAQLPALITAASRALANHLGYPAHLREGEQETVAGQGGVYVWLRAGQVRRLVSVTVYGAALAAGEVAIDCAKAGRLVRRRGRWPFTGSSTGGIVPIPARAHDTGDILVEYDAGWRTPGQVEVALAADPTSTLTSELPEELVEAALVTLAALRSGAGRDPNVTARSMGDASVSYTPDRLPLPPFAKQLAAPHCKPRGGGR